MLTALLVALALSGAVAAAPAQQAPLQPPAPAASPRPLVIWHGLGDTAHSEGMDAFAERVRELYPGIYVHNVVAPRDASSSEESRAGWWGSAVGLGEDVCEQLSEIDELAGGFDAIGFSQGGLFIRYYAQYCNDPPVRNLITFGSPHFGIAALIPCPDPPTVACTLAARAAKAGIYTGWAQRNLIQAQYYRDPARLDEFLLANQFIRALNGEGGLDDDGEPTGREHGGLGLGQVENVVAIAFDEDETVVPGLSAHWATIDTNNASTVVPLKEQQLYQDDLIGLRALDKKGRLHLLTCPGRHMEIGGDGECGDKVLEKWVGWRA
ncbi:Palmitoyl-protein thioesterase 1 [Vanrija pseudolonga]|uniref:Palmitoyl-protein thioesterase 1 n=1 Tax=Vanrija pseudolonga TaxID=143232 RepID=A0AAF1BUC5_9TREE|nr:Palmitoyl-protein thioesterase 1 [Vanrija pseudolonga]